MKKNLRSTLTKSPGVTAVTLCLASLLASPATAQQSPAEGRNPSEEKATVKRAPATAGLNQAASTATDIFGTSASSKAPLRLATDEAKECTDRKLAGHHVRGKDGKDLGSVKDFLVNPESGEVVFGLVSSGGIGSMGDKLRLVPFKALQPGSKKDEFSLMLDRAQWDQVAVVKEDTFKDGRFSVTADERRAMTAQFGSMESSPSAPASFYTQGLTSHLLRASELRGRDVRSGTKEIGRIESLVIDSAAGTATALFEPKKDMATGQRKFLVPLNRLTLGTGKRDAVMTLLTAADFEHVYTGLDSVSAVSTSHSDAAAAQAARNTDQTARTSPPASPAKSQNSTTLASTATSSQTAATEKSADVVAADRKTETSSDRNQTAATNNKNVARDSSANRVTEPSQDIAAGAPSGRIAATGDGEKTAANAIPSTKKETAAAHEYTVASTSVAASGGDQRKEMKQPETVAAHEKSIAEKSAITSTPGADTAAADGNKASTHATEQPAKRAADIATSTPARPSGDENLTPTGQTSADQNPQGASGTLITTARAVRKALDDDATLARLNVQVTPENGKLVLRGTVGSEELKSTIQEKAKRTVHATEIDNQLTVENK